VTDGVVDCISTDHAPHTAEEKADFISAPNGVIGLETSLASALTVFYHTGKLPLRRIVELMCVNPRKIAGLDAPAIREGAKADIALVDLNAEWTVEPGELVSKSKNTPFKGMTLKGRNICTISSGIVRYDIAKAAALP
jgi:dihydroorotase